GTTCSSTRTVTYPSLSRASDVASRLGSSKDTRTNIYTKNRNLLASKYSLTSSTPIQRRCSDSATAPAVFEPANGSTTRSPSSVSSLTKNSGSAAGNRAG